MEKRLSAPPPRELPNVIAKEKFSMYNYMVIVAVAVGSVASGMVGGIISTTLAQPSFLQYFGFLTDTKSNTALVGATLGVFYAGGFAGTLTMTWVADTYGRKMVLFVASIISILSSALLASSVHIAMFLVFRFTAGVASGMYISGIILLQSELSPPHFRGLMVGLASVAQSIGYTIAGWVGVAFYFVDAGGAQWRIPFALTAVPAILALLALIKVPESPRWLVMKKKLEKASLIVQKLHGSIDESSQQFGALEIEQMKAQIQFEMDHSVSWWTLLASKRFRVRALLTILVSFIAQSGGVLVITNYGPTIYKSLGFSTVAQLCLGAGYTTSSILWSFVSTLLIDGKARVKFIIAGTIAQIVCMIVVTGLIANLTETTNLATLGTIVAMFYLFEFGFALFTEPTSFTYIAEIWPVLIRAKGVALGICAIFVMDTALTTASLYAFTFIKWKFYLVFIIVPAAFTFLFWLLAQETTGKSLEEMGELFGDTMIVQTLHEKLTEDSPS